MTDKLAERGEAAVKAALEFWNDDIIDPKGTASDAQSVRSRAFIDSIIRTDKGLGWTWEHKYLGDGDFAWCGAFVAACYAKAGLALAIRKKDFASTYRLDHYANPRGLEGQTMYDEKVRKYCKCESVEDILLFGVQPGDIALVGEKGHGTHIVLISHAIDKDTPPFISCIEGNGFGAGPEGNKREGVVKKSRSLEAIRRLIRPALIDFDSV